MSLLPLLGRNWFLRLKKCHAFAGEPPRNSGTAFVPDYHLPIGVMFFPSLPFVGVMLLSSFMLGNASGEDSIFLVSLSLFSPLLSLSLLFSPFPSFSVSLPLFPFPSSSRFHLFFLSFRLSLPLFPSSFLSLVVFLLLFLLFLLPPFPFLPHLILSPFPSLFLSLKAFFFFLGNCLYCVFPRCKG